MLAGVGDETVGGSTMEVEYASIRMTIANIYCTMTVY